MHFQYTDPPTCNEDPAEYITQAYAVEGYKIVFHGVTGVECHWILTRVTSHHTENTSEVVISEIKTADNGSCIVCQDQTALTSYYIYKVTADSYSKSLVEFVKIYIVHIFITFNYPLLYFCGVSLYKFNAYI